MVTGRISLRAPEYSPISSSVRRGAPQQLVAPLPGRDGVGDQDQRGGLRPGPSPRPRRGSCRPRRAARPRRSRRARTRRRPGAGRAAATSRPRRGRCGWASPSTYPATSSAGQPTLSSSCLRWPRSEGCTATRSGSIQALADQRRDPLVPQHLLEHRPVGGAQHQPVLARPSPGSAGRSGPSCRRRRRAGRAARRSGCSVIRALTTCSASCPAARAFHRPSGVTR